MVNDNKEKPTPKRCICGAEPIWTKAKLGYFYACPDCLVRSCWSKNLDKATDNWNLEISQAWNERLVKQDG